MSEYHLHTDSAAANVDPKERSVGNPVVQLIRKDLYLHRWISTASFVAALGALGILAVGGEANFYMGGVLLVTVLIALGAILASLTVVEERQKQTLPFIMSLPVSMAQYARAKLLANLLIFGATWTVLLLGTLALILTREELPNGLTVYMIVVLTEIFVSTCLILAVAMLSESLPWTLSTIMFGNLVFNGFIFHMFRTSAFVAAAESPRVVWPREALSLLLIEFASITLLLGITYAIAARRRSVL
jgi:ABC-type transport system involved in multi-copper enzyme maturation permease subunit